MQPKQKLVTVNFLLVTFLNFLFSVTFYLMAVVMTGYATTEFGESSSTGSFAVSIYIFSSLLGRVFLGPKVDVWGPKKALMIAFGINLVVCLMYFAPATWGSFLALRFAQGICFALEGCAAATAAVFLIPPERKAEGVGYFSLSQVLGSAIGPFLAATLVRTSMGYTLIFIVLTVVAVAGITGSCLVRIPALSSPNAEKKPQKFAGVSSLISVHIVPVAVVMFLVFIGYGAILSYALEYASTKGLDDAASFFFLAYAAATFVSRMLIGRIIDVKGFAVVLVPSISFGALGFVVLAWASSGLVLLVSAALLGLGIGTTQSAIQAMVAAKSPAEELGKANSTFFISLDAGSAIGPIALGFVAPIIGFETAFYILAAITLASLALYLMERSSGKAL